MVTLTARVDLLNSRSVVHNFIRISGVLVAISEIWNWWIIYSSHSPTRNQQNLILCHWQLRQGVELKCAEGSTLTRTDGLGLKCFFKKISLVFLTCYVLIAVSALLRGNICGNLHRFNLIVYRSHDWKRELEYYFRFQQRHINVDDVLVW